MLKLLLGIGGKLLGWAPFILGFLAGKKANKFKVTKYEAEVLKKQRDIANAPDNDPIARMQDNEL